MARITRIFNHEGAEGAQRGDRWIFLHAETQRRKAVIRKPRVHAEARSSQRPRRKKFNHERYEPVLPAGFSWCDE